MTATRAAAMRSLPKFLFPESMTTDFTVHNLPYGVFSRKGADSKRIGVALGNKILDCNFLAEKALLPQVFAESSLNPFMALGKDSWAEARSVLQRLVADEDDKNLKQLSAQNGFDLSDCFVSQDDATLHLPCSIGDYTDFYASREHATNVGTMFRDPSNALLPNWLHLPVGYHGRASSVKVSGTPVVRPNGQTVAKDAPDGPPTFGPSRLVDFELEVGAFVGGPPTQLGEHLSKKEAEDRIFGLVLYTS